MRFNSFSITVGLAILHAFLLAPWLASFDTPVATEVNVAISIFALGAVLLHGYLVYKAGPAVNPATIAAELHARQLESTAATARAQPHTIDEMMDQLMDRQFAAVHPDHLCDALAYGMAGMRIYANAAGVQVEPISFHDIMKPAEVAEARRARLWSLLQCPDAVTGPCIDEVLRVDMTKPGSAGTVREILSRRAELAKVVQVDMAMPGAERTVVAFLDRQLHAHYHTVPFKIKKQSHGGARKRAQLRRAAGAHVEAAAKAQSSPATMILRPRQWNMAKLRLQLQAVAAITSGRITGAAV